MTERENLNAFLTIFCWNCYKGALNPLFDSLILWQFGVNQCWLDHAPTGSAEFTRPATATLGRLRSRQFVFCLRSFLWIFDTFGWLDSRFKLRHSESICSWHEWCPRVAALQQEAVSWQLWWWGRGWTLRRLEIWKPDSGQCLDTNQHGRSFFHDTTICPWSHEDWVFFGSGKFSSVELSQVSASHRRYLDKSRGPDWLTMGRLKTCLDSYNEQTDGWIGWRTKPI